MNHVRCAIGRSGCLPILRVRRQPIALILLLWLTFICDAVFAGAPDDSISASKLTVFYVAPHEAGDESGKSAVSPANFRNSFFWSRVRQTLQNGSVIVNFLDGKYLVSADENKELPTLFLKDMGHDGHQLTLQAISQDGVLFTRLESDIEQTNTGPGFLTIRNSQNIVIRNLHFTAKSPIGYATHFSGKNILVEDCSWIDLPGVFYGATGTAGGDDHVTFRNCVFKRIGSGPHAHMAYNAYGPQHIAFIDCWFEDCSGDYVRFRDSTDYGVVVGCTFKSTGTYRSVNMPFVAVPLFNDDDPKNPVERNGKNVNYEYFGTHFLIFNNKFLYDSDVREGKRVALVFHHSGFDPPGCHHLLTPEQAKLLAEGNLAEKKSLMRENFHIDTDCIHFFNNSFTGVDLKVAYSSRPAYGAKSKGWEGIIDITDLVNSKSVVHDESKALTFFGDDPEATSK